jgi:hypothetical protein
MKPLTIVIVVAVIFACLTCGLLFKITQVNKNHDQLVNLLGDTINHYEILVTKKGEQIAVQEQRIASQENAIAAGLIREEELKKQNIKQAGVVIRLTQQVERLQLQVNITNPDVVTITDKDTVCPEGTFLRVPADFLWEDEWTYLGGTILGPSIRVNALRVTLKPTIILGYQKPSFFKPLKPVVTVGDLNPHASIISMENVVIQNKPPFYKTTWWYRFEGALATFGILKGLSYIH